MFPIPSHRSTTRRRLHGARQRLGSQLPQLAKLYSQAIVNITITFQQNARDDGGRCYCIACMALLAQ